MRGHDDMNLTPQEQRLQDSVRGLGEVRADDAFREKLRQQFVSGELAESAGIPMVMNDCIYRFLRKTG